MLDSSLSSPVTVGRWFCPYWPLSRWSTSRSRGCLAVLETIGDALITPTAFAACSICLFVAISFIFEHCYSVYSKHYNLTQKWCSVTPGNYLEYSSILQSKTRKISWPYFGVYEIWGLHYSKYLDFGLLRYDTLYPRMWLHTFRRNLLPPSSAALKVLISFV
jgi:hypothetical protein